MYMEEPFLLSVSVYFYVHLMDTDHGAILFQVTSDSSNFVFTILERDVSNIIVDNKKVFGRTWTKTNHALKLHFKINNIVQYSIFY